ncbi:MAG: sn-glycerol-3-phosphate ABC transporter ATP-binding protein UgpC [Candidatus Eisenbacteria bacterium]|nr:sn-glycerol-3-phosphate ABC transporter ATP-binding protein UgpC [Candidatus Eisenbacteria bacterium]
MARVDIDSVSKVYEGGVKAVDAASFTVNNEELVVLVGPSGCGKTTLLRMVAGLEVITSGTIQIGGRVVNDVAPKDRDIAMVFQSYALYPHMSVYDNMAFGLKLRKIPKDEIERRVRAAAETLDLVPYLDRKPRALSGGQRQRVAVGRAIVRQPQVFLFDEPLSNLDAALRVQMRSEINQLHQRLSATMIYVTHDQVEAMTMADRIVVMRAGRIEQFDAPLQLYHRPVNRFVAGFIGSPAMNFLKGHLEPGGLAFQSGDLRIALPAAHSASLLPLVGKELELGIRPEDLLPTKPADASANLSATVKLVEPMGSETFVHLVSGSNALLARLAGDRVPTVGSVLELYFDPARCHFFDAAGGLALWHSGQSIPVAVSAGALGVPS